MSNRFTKGRGLYGALTVTSTATFANLNTTGTLSLAGTAVDATSTELNNVADLSANIALPKVKVVQFTHGGATTEVDTAYDLPTQGIVRSVSINVRTASTAGGKIDVGLLASSSGGDADGFLLQVGTSTTGWSFPNVTVSTSGSPGNFYSARTYGVLLGRFAVGTTAANDFGVAFPLQYVIDSVTARSLTYTINSTSTTFAADLVIDHIERA